MAKYVLIITLLIEIGLSISCIQSKSNRIRLRSVLRISAIIVFMLCLIVAVIKWSFRWVAFALLLTILAAIGISNLIRNKKDVKEYKCGRTIRKSILMFLLAFIALIPGLIFPEYKMIETTGKYKVSTVLYTYIDKNRIETYKDTGENRKLNVEFWYPAESDEKFPLVVFSHGSFGTKTSNESLFNELASNGYVVCSIDHTYQCLYTTDISGDTTLMDMGYVREISAEDAKSDKQKSFEYYKKWMGVRTGDINYVIDQILEEVKNNTAEDVYKLVDISKIAVMGHSLGGSAALGIGRIRNDVDAAVALESPFMCDIEGVKDNKFILNNEAYPIPVLNVYSDGTWSRLSQLAQYEENYKLLTDSEATAFNVYIKGAGHLSLTDLSLASPFLTRMLNGQKSEIAPEYCLKIINQITLDFFDCYLKGQGKFTAEGTY